MTCRSLPFECAAVLAAAAILVAGCSGEQERAAAPEIDSLSSATLEEAMAALQSADYTQALFLAESVEARRPRLTETDYVRGQIFFDLEMYEPARRYWTEVLDAEPDYWLWHHNLGEVAFHQERFEEAVSHYRRAAELDPNPVSLQGLANAYWEIGERDSTVQILARAIEVDDSYAPIHFSLSAIAEELQDLDKARRHIHDAVALDSTNVDYQLSAGVIDYKLALYDEARDHLQQVLAAEPMNHTALYNYGQALQRSGQREEGSRYLQLAETAREQDRALALLRQAVANNPTNAQNQLALARTLHGIGRLDEALRAYKAADLLSPGNAQIRHAIATLHLERGDLEEAIRRYRSIIATDTLPEAWLNLGLAYARMDSLERAHAVWREAGKRFPDHPAVVQVLERIGD